MWVSLHLPRKHAGLRDILLDSLTMRSCRFSVRDASLMISLYETIQIRRLLMALGSGMGIFAFTDLLGNLDRLNATHLALHIRRKARGYFPHTETP